MENNLTFQSISLKNDRIVIKYSQGEEEIPINSKIVSFQAANIIFSYGYYILNELDGTDLFEAISIHHPKILRKKTLEANGYLPPNFLTKSNSLVLTKYNGQGMYERIISITGDSENHFLNGKYTNKSPINYSEIQKILYVWGGIKIINDYSITAEVHEVYSKEFWSSPLGIALLIRE